MVYKNTFCKSVDNSGIVYMKCIHIHGGFKKRLANISDLVTISCRKVVPKKKKRPFYKGDVVKGIVIATKVLVRKKNKIGTSFEFNGIVPIQKKAQQEWLGPKLGCTRLKSPIGFSLDYDKIHKETKKKLFSLANKVIR